MTRSAQVRSPAPTPAPPAPAAALEYDASGVAQRDWTTFVEGVDWTPVEHVEDIWVKLFDCPRCGHGAQLTAQLSWQPGLMAQLRVARPVVLVHRHGDVHVVDLLRSGTTSGFSCTCKGTHPGGTPGCGAYYGQIDLPHLPVKVFNMVQNRLRPPPARKAAPGARSAKATPAKTTPAKTKATSASPARPSREKR